MVSLNAWWQLLVFRLILWRTGFSGVRHWVARAPTSARMDGLDARALEAVVGRASIVLPVWTRCLGRAAVLARILRARGHTAYVVVGVRAQPFSSHAWVETETACLGLGDAERGLAELDRF